MTPRPDTSFRGEGPRRPEHRRLRHQRRLTFERGAVHQTTMPRVVERCGTVLRAAVVPQERVAHPPNVPVDKFRPVREIEQVINELLGFALGQTFDLAGPTADVEGR